MGLCCGLIGSRKKFASRGVAACTRNRNPTWSEGRRFPLRVSLSQLAALSARHSNGSPTHNVLFTPPSQSSWRVCAFIDFNRQVSVRTSTSHDWWFTYSRVLPHWRVQLTWIRARLFDPLALPRECTCRNPVSSTGCPKTVTGSLRLVSGNDQCQTPS